MTTIFNLRGTFLLSSIYDGQSYYSRENTLEESKYLENKKRQKFNQKIKDLAKEHLDVDFDIVT